MFENVKITKEKKVIDKNILIVILIVGVIFIVANSIQIIVSYLADSFGTYAFYRLSDKINYIYNIEHFRLYLNFGLIMYFIISALLNRKFDIYGKIAILFVKMLCISFMLGLPSLIIWAGVKWIDYLGHDGFGETLIVIGILMLIFNIVRVIKGED